MTKNDSGLETDQNDENAGNSGRHRRRLQNMNKEPSDGMKKYK